MDLLNEVLQQEQAIQAAWERAQQEARERLSQARSAGEALLTRTRQEAQQEGAALAEQARLATLRQIELLNDEFDTQAQALKEQGAQHLDSTVDWIVTQILEERHGHH